MRPEVRPPSVTGYASSARPEVHEDVPPGLERWLEVDEREIGRAPEDVERYLEGRDHKPVEREKPDNPRQQALRRRESPLEATA